MSLKDVKDYYNNVSNQYSEMLKCLKEMEKEYNESLVSPEQYEQMKSTIEPLKNNYMTLSWIMYLLNQPNKKEKIDKYKKQNKKKLESLDKTKSKDSIINQNNSILNKLKNNKDS